MANEDIFHLGVKALIKNKKGQVLVLHSNPKYSREDNTPDHWDLPGGRLQKGQSIEETLTREVEEEIGIKHLKIIKLLDASISKLRLMQENYGLILFTYLCSIGDPDNVKLMDDEHTEYRWCSPEEAAGLLSTKFSNSLVEVVRKV